MIRLPDQTHRELKKYHLDRLNNERLTANQLPFKTYANDYINNLIQKEINKERKG